MNFSSLLEKCSDLPGTDAEQAALLEDSYPELWEGTFPHWQRS